MDASDGGAGEVIFANVEDIEVVDVDVGWIGIFNLNNWAIRASSVFDLVESAGVCVGFVVVVDDTDGPVAFVGVLLAFVMDVALTAEPSNEIGKELGVDERS